MAGRTISFPKGDGSMSHNNREFIANNVCPERTSWNKTYIKESEADAYEKCFGEAIREYNAAQKRNDRKIKNYRKKIENSDNGEKVFYENIVQLGTKHDTPVVDKNGNLTQAAKEAVDLLDEYARTFQERNPNLYLFNCVLHLDESTPHLHIDYIPVAHGYKKGMKTRNSISKALQQMGFEKGKGRYDNEVIDWEARERNYLTDLCKERGIEVEIKGDKRDNLTLPEYKAAMRKVEILEEQAEQMEYQNQELEAKTEELFKEIQELEEKESSNRDILKQHDLRAAEFKLMEREADAETGKVKSAAIPISNLFGGEEYVKVKKSDWNKIVDVFHKAVSRNHLLDKYEKKIYGLEKKVTMLSDQVEKLKRFVAAQGLGEVFAEFVKSLAPKSFKQKLEKARAEATENNRQRNVNGRELSAQNKHRQQEI